MPQQLMTIMTPMLALILWTFVIWIVLYARRIPAMRKAGIDPAKIKGSESYASMPPIDPKAVWAADNYNHLHEQPTLFYALCVYTQWASPMADALNIWLAWGYVAVRIVHSIIQITTNYVPLRFLVFNIGTLLLVVIAVRDALGLFGI